MFCVVLRLLKVFYTGIIIYTISGTYTKFSLAYRFM